ncbi:MaoC/PaaZ C-terminal domain-containing protein [uncultured Pseudacidovorax sp.]|uniref:MaoC/PaaZ C-terminal domain-containing protein n=1 Tax=uncultured Pseudacidovorax sp. TaxID=679313 RepID=UPI0026013AC0|nr:MaoC/PaaZ C-terminal domain-containing protein [uncultured Pseudacidovorax sp.]
MPLNADAIAALAFPPQQVRISDKDAMLFALSVGMGADPMDDDELRYVYEQDLEIFPTMPIVLGHPGPWMADASLGINRQMLVHGTQRLMLHGRLQVHQPLIARNRVLELVDKGAAGGALIVMERALHDAASGELLARIESGTFCRADGGFGGRRQLSYEFRAVPERAADGTVEVHTVPSQALLYRLNGDRNPLHASPAFAARAGFARPILHGLCTYSLAARALMKLNPGRRLRCLEARFSKPVYPGETIRVVAWTVADGVSFNARVDARNATVLDRGFAVFD